MLLLTDQNRALETNAPGANVPRQAWGNLFREFANFEFAAAKLSSELAGIFCQTSGFSDARIYLGIMNRQYAHVEMLLKLADQFHGPAWPYAAPPGFGAECVDSPVAILESKIIIHTAFETSALGVFTHIATFADGLFSKPYSNIVKKTLVSIIRDYELHSSLTEECICSEWILLDDIQKSQIQESVARQLSCIRGTIERTLTRFHRSEVLREDIYKFTNWSLSSVPREYYRD